MLALLWCFAGLGTGFAQTRYEAENATLDRAGKTIHANASPTGSTANNCVSQNTDNAGVNNGTVTFPAVTVPTSGLYTMTIGYYEAWGTRNTFISVNGKELAAPVPCPNGASPDLLGAVTASVPLKAGIDNTIAIYNHKAWGPHWDYIEIPATPDSLLAFVSASAEANGTISPSGLVAVTPGGSQDFTVTSDNLYLIDKVMDGATELTGTAGVYTIGPVNDDTHSIVATFTAAVTHTITASAGAGGSINPDGATLVTNGGSLTYTIIPEWNYDIGSVLIDGSNDPGAVASASHTFDNVTADHTINATFAAKPLVNVSGTVTVGSVATDSATVNVYTDAECTNLVTFTDTASGGTYTMPLPQDMTLYLKATKSDFVPSEPLLVAIGTVDLPGQNLDITARRYEAEDAVLANANIANEDPPTYYFSGGKAVSTPNDGIKCTVTFSVDAPTAGPYTMVMGYRQVWEGNRSTSLSVNGVAQPNIPGPNAVNGRSSVRILLNAGPNTVVLGNVVWGVQMDYIDIPLVAGNYVINTFAGFGGSISPSDVALMVAPGANQTFIITADPGYVIEEVLVDGINDLAAVASGSYTFDAVTDDHTIYAWFIENPSDPYAAWLTNPPLWTLTGDDAATASDPDGDGVSNFQEFAFGLNPVLGSSVNPITAPLDKDTRKFSYTRGAATGLNYTVWVSSDLLDWGAGPVAAEQVVGEPIDGVRTVEVTLPDPVPAGGKVFVRVQAE